MQYYKIRNILLQLLLISLVCIACSQSDAQREFEREAQASPENITEMSVEGQPVENGMTDPDDWRTSPMYRGLIEIYTPAYPNPVNSGTSIRILLENNFINTINGIEVYAFQIDFSNQIGPLYILGQSSIYEGIITIQIDSTPLFGQGVGSTDIARILIYDDRQNLISYGDVRVTQ